MASIYIYNLKGGKCVELSTPRIEEEDIAKLKAVLPTNLEGLSFESPLSKFSEQMRNEVRKEERDNRVAEYLKGIGSKLEQLSQVPGALRFYDLAFRIGRNSELLLLQARTLGQLGYVDRAEKLLKHYLQANPKSPEPYFMFGKHALSRADYDTAKKHFEHAQALIRPANVEHKKLQENLDIYTRFVSIYLDRDQLFTRNLDPKTCIDEIGQLRRRTQVLSQDIKEMHNNDLEGMGFFLDTQDKIFEKWLQEMALK